MSYTGDNPPSSNTTSSSNSASQYAAAALGVGLVALGIVMVVWTVVPAGSVGNSSRPGQGLGSTSNTSVAAFVMLGVGVAMLLLALCLGVRNKRREQRQQQTNGNAQIDQSQPEERQAEHPEHYAVPSYEEVVGSEQYPIRQFTARQDSTTQLPAYEELIETPQSGLEGPESAHTQPTQTQNGTDDSNPTHTHPPGSNHRTGRPGLKLLPVKVRRIKSEKLGRKVSSSSTQVAVSNIEPLTPPPQYDDSPPELPHLPQ
ncbi:transmembrane protein 51a [Pygocentrus nattereri]|uniref:Transmembrane protein 51b n=1 Tax=Pygocentrus nattereri TaxID=42514 RepID=A0AAR2JQJ6_PYGNA|nr:transmembrane protein 51a [Pygocentrus nattereri]XP_017548996.1 transmembrane protein 51a [Pygocentrus nattereri]